MSNLEIEKRVTAVERKVADLARKLSEVPAPSADMNDWIDQIHGTFRNDATYQRAARLGRKWRKSSGKIARRSSTK
jgi:hypothetical protein